jgi:hypothetical protein
MNHVQVIFKGYMTLSLTFLFIIEILSYIKQNIDLIYNSDIHEHNTRRKGDLYIQPCNNQLLKKTVINKGTKVYNRLLCAIKKTETFKDFKKNLKIFLLNYSFHTLDEYFSFNE